jgi:hypothetical protein
MSERTDPQTWFWRCMNILLFSIWPVGAYFAFGPWGGFIGHLFVSWVYMLIIDNAETAARLARRR